jgi:hypothetical protein
MGRVTHSDARDRAARAAECPALDLTLHQVHAGRAQESCYEQVRWTVVEVERRTCLFEASASATAVKWKSQPLGQSPMNDKGRFQDGAIFQLHRGGNSWRFVAK